MLRSMVSIRLIPSLRAEIVRKLIKNHSSSQYLSYMTLSILKLCFLQPLALCWMKHLLERHKFIGLFHSLFWSEDALT